MSAKQNNVIQTNVIGVTGVNSFNQIPSDEPEIQTIFILKG